MNILPKKYSEFKDKQYWNKFFQQLKSTQNQFFEWYGSYSDFSDQLKKILQHINYKNSTGASIFHIGCGKSTFGQDIFLDYPQLQIINSDYSQQIIKDMIKRSLTMKTMCKYQVCDMLNDLPEKYNNRFNVILDKGTLDAILPQDLQQQIIKIKQHFFRNIEKCFKQDQTCSYLIVTMLQPFVLRTILQYFYIEHDKNLSSKYEIQIQQSRIKDSKMHPFLVYIKRYSNKQAQSMIDKGKITIKLKGASSKELQFVQINQVMKQIASMQQTTAYSQKVKQLLANQHLTYSITPPGSSTPRYSIQIIDHSQVNILKQNNCSIFIVPQGKQNSTLYNTTKGLKRLIKQVNTSRLIVVKLLIGNTFKNIQQVRKQIDTFVANFVQRQCNLQDCPIMTDADQLGSRKYIYQDQTLFIQQITTSDNKQQGFRRLVLKNNLSLIQTNFRLIYQNADQYSTHLQLKELQKKTKILPAKKGKIIKIDSSYMDQDTYGQFIISGLVRLLAKSIQKSSILVLGGGGYSIPKFIYQNYDKKPSITTIQIQKNLCTQQILPIFQVDQHVKQPNFKIINQDAYQYIKNYKQTPFDSIIVDVSGTQDQGLPTKQFLTQQFFEKSHRNLQQNGVLIFNVIRNNFLKNQFLNKILALIIKNKWFSLIYIARLDEDQQYQQTKQQTKQQKVNQSEDEDFLILYLVKGNKQNSQSLTINSSEINLNVNCLSKVQQEKFTFLQRCLHNIKLVYPINKLQSVKQISALISNQKINIKIVQDEIKGKNQVKGVKKHK